MDSSTVNNLPMLHPHPLVPAEYRSSAQRQKGLTGYYFKYIDRPFSTV